MNRRKFNSAPLALFAAASSGASSEAWGLMLKDLTEYDASQGIRAALDQGALAALNLLSQPDGFLGNPKVRIALPGFLDDVGKILKTLGQGRQVEELVISMNRAAEAAVPLAKGMLLGTIKAISVNDALRIVSGGDNAATVFFAEKTREPLGVKFLPIVTKAIEKVSLSEKYNRLVSRAAGLGLVRPEEASVQQYVTGKSLDGLYFMIGEEEKKIRSDPIGTGSAVLKKVFGALR